MRRLFKKSPLKSTKLAQRKRRMVIVRMILVFVVIGFLLAGMSWASQVSSLRITDVIVQGTVGVDAESLRQIAQEKMSGRYYFLLSKANKLIYPNEAITASVLNSSARIEKAEVEVEGHSLIISIAERKPTSTWCDGRPGGRTQNECYLIDEDGYIFADAPVFSGNAYFEYYGGGISNDTAVGSRFMSPEEFRDVSLLIQKVKAAGVPSYALELSGETCTLHVDTGGTIFFKKGDDYDKMVSTIETLVKNTGIFSPSTDLDYVDLRFGNKIYYKVVGDNADKQVEE